MQEYDFKITYKPGKSNIAEQISRLCIYTNLQKSHLEDEYHINQIVQYARPIALSLKSIIDASNNDDEFKLVKDALSTNNWNTFVNQYKLFEYELWAYDGILLRGNKIVIPLMLRKQVLAAAHEGRIYCNKL